MKRRDIFKWIGATGAVAVSHGRTGRDLFSAWSWKPFTPETLCNLDFEGLLLANERFQTHGEMRANMTVK